MRERLRTGVGPTDFGDRAGRTGPELFTEAHSSALAEQDEPRADVDHVPQSDDGTGVGQLAERQGQHAPLMATVTGANEAERGKQFVGVRPVDEVSGR